MEPYEKRFKRPEAGGVAESREGEPNQVVRTFLYQSRSVESIQDDEDIAALSFTKLVLLQKSGTVNPGQLMPVGGRVNPGESLMKAAMRECVEETHLRPPKRSIRPVGVQQRYSFNHPRRGRVRNEVTYFKGKLAPPDLDIAYALDVDEDKIGSFVYLTPEETRELLISSGQINRDGKILYAQDALSPSAAQRQANGAEINPTEQARVGEEVYIHHLLTDARKKMMILRAAYYNISLGALSDSAQTHVRKLREVKSNEVMATWQDLWQQITALETNLHADAYSIIAAVDAFWRGHISNFTMQDVRTCFAYSEFGAKLYSAFTYTYSRADERYVPKYDETTGAGVPSLSLVLPLLIDTRLRPDGRPDIHKIQMIAETATGRRLLKFIQLMRRDVMRRQRYGEALSNEDIIALAEERGILSRNFGQDYETIAGSLDSYFENLRDAAGLTDADAPIDQLGEIKGADLYTLFRYARAAHHELIADLALPRITNTQEAVILQWEARRKMVLLLLLNDAYEIRQHFEHLGIKPVQEIEANALQDKAMVEWAKHLTVKNRPNDAPKNLVSLLRKIIVRDQTRGATATLGEPVRDVYANSYIFDGLSDEALAEASVEVAPYCVTDAAGKRLERITAPRVVVDLMMSLLRAGQGQVEIESYKPIPRSGEAVASNGPGGGAAVRFFKFYIKLQSNDGVRFREVQGYLPDPVTGRSGTDEFFAKKLDDDRYRVRRLFDTKGRRSFMEQLFPAAVYQGTGIRKMYKGRV